MKKIINDFLEEVLYPKNKLISNEKYKYNKYLKNFDEMEITVKTHDNVNLKCLYYKLKKYEEKEKCVIYTHRLGSSKEEGYSIIEACLENRSDFLIYDSRGCGESEGENQFGFEEMIDILFIMFYTIINLNRNKFILWGRSIGCCSILQLVSHLSLTQYNAEKNINIFLLNNFKNFLSKNFTQSSLAFNFEIIGMVIDSPIRDICTAVKNFSIDNFTILKYLDFANEQIINIVKEYILEKSKIDITKNQNIDILKNININTIFLFCLSDKFITEDDKNESLNNFNLFLKKKAFMNVFYTKNNHVGIRDNILMSQILKDIIENSLIYQTFYKFSVFLPNDLKLNLMISQNEQKIKSLKNCSSINNILPQINKEEINYFSKKNSQSHFEESTKINLDSKNSVNLYGHSFIPNKNQLIIDTKKIEILKNKNFNLYNKNSPENEKNNSPIKNNILNSENVSHKKFYIPQRNSGSSKNIDSKRKIHSCIKTINDQNNNVFNFLDTFENEIRNNYRSNDTKLNNQNLRNSDNGKFEKIQTHQNLKNNFINTNNNLNYSGPSKKFFFLKNKIDLNTNNLNPTLPQSLGNNNFDKNKIDFNTNNFNPTLPQSLQSLGNNNFDKNKIDFNTKNFNPTLHSSMNHQKNLNNQFFQNKMIFVNPNILGKNLTNNQNTLVNDNRINFGYQNKFENNTMNFSKNIKIENNNLENDKNEKKMSFYQNNYQKKFNLEDLKKKQNNANNNYVQIGNIDLETNQIIKKISKFENNMISVNFKEKESNKITQNSFNVRSNQNSVEKNKIQNWRAEKKNYASSFHNNIKNKESQIQQFQNKNKIELLLNYKEQDNGKKTERVNKIKHPFLIFENYSEKKKTNKNNSIRIPNSISNGNKLK